MAKTGATGITRVINAAGYSWLGFKAVYKNEAAFRQELFLCLVATPIALIFGDNFLEKSLMIACLVLILIVEILNSAIEAVVDRIGDEHHELSGRAKDMGSAAVFLAFVFTNIVWLGLLL